MTKADIVNEIARSTGIEKITAQKSIEAFMDIVRESLSKEETIFLRGFGSFAVRKRAAKTARNISKNTTMLIPEHFVPTFKPSRELQDAVKNGK